VAGTNGHAVGHGAGPAQPTATPTAEASDPEEDRPADQATAVRVLSHWRTLWFEHTRQPYKPDAEERRRGLHNLRHLIGRHGEGEVIRCMEWAFMAGKNIYWPTVSAFATSATIMRIQAESSASGRSTSKTANNHANMMALADRLEREAKTIDAEVIR
jgi:hypothetical protein